MAGGYHLKLEVLGWKGFQDLSTTVAAEVFGQEVESFLGSGDAGQDGAFTGTWRPRESDDRLSGRYVFQCKYSSKPSPLTATDMTDEFEKAALLAERGLCDIYALITNRPISGASAARIEEQLKSSGIRTAFIFGREWLERTVHESPRLRALVPRLYGLGDLSEILDERSYQQAAAVLDSMRESLGKFVVTAPYRSAMDALRRHGFVLLLGEPAAGKTMIASALCVAAADLWGVRVAKEDGPREVGAHWNPNAKDQLFWVDDAFGVRQHDSRLTDEWNRLMPKVAAATRGGTRFVLTSRDYIYSAARDELKRDHFPLVAEAQVVIDVAALPLADREQIVYNHMKLGRQPHSFKRAVKPYLREVANSQRFLPEVARRLADPVFTQDLLLDHESIHAFVNEPLQLLLEIIGGLDADQRAALSLIFISGGQLESPLIHDGTVEHAIELQGSNLARCREALQAMRGSLVELVEHGARAYWTVKHPTILDAIAQRTAADRELLEIYLGGVSAEKLMNEVTCGDVGIEGAHVVVPPRYYQLVVEKIGPPENIWWGWGSRQVWFLGLRCSDDFLEAYFKSHPELLDLLLTPHGYLRAGSPGMRVLRKLYGLGLIDEARRLKFVNHIASLTTSIGDPAFLEVADVQSILRSEEVERLRGDLRKYVLRDLEGSVEDWADNYIPGEDAYDHLSTFFGLLESYRAEYRDDDSVLDAIASAEVAAEELAQRLTDQEPDEPDPEELAALAFEEEGTPAPVSYEEAPRSIFDDVDA